MLCVLDNNEGELFVPLWARWPTGGCDGRCCLIACIFINVVMIGANYWHSLKELETLTWSQREVNRQGMFAEMVPKGAKVTMAVPGE